MQSLLRVWAVLGACLLQSTVAIEVDWKSPESIKEAAGTMAWDMMTYYKGNLTGFPVGVLPEPYYWWMGGAMWGTLINYWHFTGDATYNDIVKAALQAQVGEFKDYMPQEHRSSLGNDDQGFWAVAALQAAETNFPNPRPDQPSWLGLVQAVFNEQIDRWDESTCNGGLRWQIYIKGGYSLKNTISNGLLFNIAARLARYTGDDMYAQWAVKVWDWMWAINLIDHTNYNIYDNSEADLLNCTELDRLQWTYNPAILLYGAAVMYNYTDGSDLWRNRTQRLLTRIDEVFFPNTTMWEICEPNSLCDEDQRSFKAYLSRWMTGTSQLAPFTFKQVHRLLGNSAKMAASQCTGGVRGTKCGIKWWLNGTWDGTEGIGQQMCALEVTLSTLVAFDDPEKIAEGGGGSGIKPPVTNTTGGTSEGNPDAGHDSKDSPKGSYIDSPKLKDKIGAWTLTALMILAVLAASGFLMTSLFESRGVPTVAGMGKGKEKARESVMSTGLKRESAGAGSALAVMETVDEEVRPEPKYRGGSMVT